MNTLNQYEGLKKKGYAGFASDYSQACVKSESDDKIDIQVYTKLVQLDSKLGTTSSEQLFWLLNFSLRLDLFKV